MSKTDKLLKKLLNRNIVFTYPDLVSLLIKLGYIAVKTGKTSGSRVAFYNPKNKHLIRIHKPHPSNEIKKYVRNYILDELSKQGII